MVHNHNSPTPVPPAKSYQTLPNPALQLDSTSMPRKSGSWPDRTSRLPQRNTTTGAESHSPSPVRRLAAHVDDSLSPPFELQHDHGRVVRLCSFQRLDRVVDLARTGSQDALQTTRNATAGWIWTKKE